MGKYRDDSQAIHDLVRADSVHRDVYRDRELFDLEMERLWRRSWIYVGHDSQVANAGDYFTTQIGAQPVVLVRGGDGDVVVLMNRCAHRGAKVVTLPSGNCRGVFRCPYHGWTYRTDGSLRTIPLKGGYEGTRLHEGQTGRGMVRVQHVVVYRGFVFARLSSEGPSFESYFGESLSSIDNMADRSPAGRLEVAGSVLRYMHNCNWKLFIENLTDCMHPMVAHESSAGTARDLWRKEGEAVNRAMPMAVEIYLPFVSSYKFFDEMGVRVYENGHCYTGVNFSTHSNYSSMPGYERQLADAYGQERAQAVLADARLNTVYYPSLTVKGAIQAIRVVKPLAVDRTLLESWTFRLAGAPQELLERTTMYSRLVNAPTSIVGHDDLYCYEAVQEGLAAEGNEWISLHRDYAASERSSFAGVHNSTSEISMRAQYHAWKKFMSADWVNH